MIQFGLRLHDAEKLPVEQVLEDSYNGVRAGAAGGFVTVMVPDLSPATDEMRRLYTCECTSLHEVCKKLEAGAFDEGCGGGCR